MTDRPEGEDNRARWGLYSPKSAMDRDILMFVTGAYVGPALEESDDWTDPETDSPKNIWGFWGGFFDWLVPDKVKAWFSNRPGFDSYKEGSADLLALIEKLDAEPDPSFYDKYYSNPDNEGYGYL
ncbi:expressed unknown protein [Seminavis robusta]|nr:expressed unknown protein [Seminavis robusta]|eukprot:Sro1924_g305750.1 n/a (125) ;mRNA; r:20254-20628